MSNLPEHFIDGQIHYIVCAAHGEHLRERWPKGWAPFFLTLCRSVLMDQAFGDAWGELLPVDIKEATQAQHYEAMNQLIATKPMCYWASRELIRKAYYEARIGRLIKCGVCRKSGLGGPYLVTTPRGVQKIKLCFECALDAGERMHQQYPDGNPPW